jgi:hypothetical protein
MPDLNESSSSALIATYRCLVGRCGNAGLFS